MSATAEDLKRWLRPVTSAEELRALPDWQDANSLTLETYQATLCSIAIPRNATPLNCCVEKPGGKLCQQRHWRGAVMRKTDGTLTNAGSCCVKEIDPNLRIQADMRLVSNEDRRQQRLDELRELVARQPEVLKKLDDARKKVFAKSKVDGPCVRAGGDRFETKLSRLYADRIGSARHPVEVGFVVEERDDDGRPVERVYWKTIGYLQGLKVTHGPSVRHLLTSLSKKRIAVSELCVVPDNASIEEVNKMRRDVGDVDDLLTHVSEFEKEARRFLENDFSLMCYLTQNPKNRERLARLALRKVRADVSSANAADWLRRNDERLCKEHRAVRLTLA